MDMTRKFMTNYAAVQGSRGPSKSDFTARKIAFTSKHSFVLRSSDPCTEKRMVFAVPGCITFPRLIAYPLNVLVGYASTG